MGTAMPISVGATHSHLLGLAVDLLRTTPMSRYIPIGATMDPMVTDARIMDSANGTAAGLLPKAA